MYEPPQDGSPIGVEVLEDPRETQVATLARLLGFTKVGWVYAHPPRQEGFIITAREVILASLQQLEVRAHLLPDPQPTFTAHGKLRRKRACLFFGAVTALAQCPGGGRC